MVGDGEGDWVRLLTPPVLLTLWLCDWEPVVVPVPAPDDPDAQWVPLVVPELVPETCDEAVAQCRHSARHTLRCHGTG